MISNPGHSKNVGKSPRGKGRPKGTPKKSKGFQGKTLNKVNTSLTHSNDISNCPIGVVNIANVVILLSKHCFR